ncbi:MAG: ribbon-helix-helix domain-containing protein [archaeon]
MKRPSVSLPEEMVDEIEERREKGVSRSEYIRDALKARFDAEDTNTWETIDDAAGAKSPAD